MGFSIYVIKNEDTESNISKGKIILDILYHHFIWNISNIEKDYLEKIIIFNINLY